MDQIAALPYEALPHYAQILGVLELAPWNGLPCNKDKSDGVMRTLLFGGGQEKVIYLILEDQRRVDVVKVMWLG